MECDVKCKANVVCKMHIQLYSCFHDMQYYYIRKYEWVIVSKYRVAFLASFTSVGKIKCSLCAYLLEFAINLNHLLENFPEKSHHTTH